MLKRKKANRGRRKQREPRGARARHAAGAESVRHARHAAAAAHSASCTPPVAPCTLLRRETKCRRQNEAMSVLGTRMKWPPSLPPQSRFRRTPPPQSRFRRTPQAFRRTTQAIAAIAKKPTPPVFRGRHLSIAGDAVALRGGPNCAHALMARMVHRMRQKIGWQAFCAALCKRA